MITIEAYDMLLDEFIKFLTYPPFEKYFISLCMPKDYRIVSVSGYASLNSIGISAKHEPDGKRMSFNVTENLIFNAMLDFKKQLTEVEKLLLL